MELFRLGVLVSCLAGCHSKFLLKAIYYFGKDVCMGDVPSSTSPKTPNPYKSLRENKLNMNKNLDKGELGESKEECGPKVHTLRRKNTRKASRKKE
jgi:hypothetical protein